MRASPCRHGRSASLVCVAPRYIPGEPPEKEAKPKREGGKRERGKPINPWEVSEENLSEFEKHRLANMQRNQEFLASLGLA